MGPLITLHGAFGWLSLAAMALACSSGEERRGAMIFASLVVLSSLFLGEGSCAFGTLDSFLEIFDDNGDVLATGDDGGEGYCARIVLPILPVGHYSARVTASVAGDTPTFPYRLLVFTDICGNGKKTIAEECDDANIANGDGCSASCRVE